MISFSEIRYCLKINKSLSSKVAVLIIFLERVNYLKYLILPFRVVILNWFYNTEIPPSVKIGRGFRIPHPYNIIIHSKSYIGNKVTLYHGVTLGANDLSLNYGAPIIEDGCFLGANSLIIGSVKIGEFSVICAGERVTVNVPEKSIYINSEINEIKNDSFSHYYKIFE
ncbi:DapH/DapD/GlmU-related protein [Shewanella basaltis]|uniref:DapH/DapD/GlmU-related protein n=1 Tax=Shewanella basaltis TaxID=472183 RepID=UPI003AB024BB